MFWRKMSFILISSLCLITLILPTKPKQANASSDFQNLHLIVSIEWQPGQQDALRQANGSTCAAFSQASLQEILTTALQETSQTLYQATDGQVWVEQYSVYTSGEHWNDADIRILANNDYRPTAFLGGFEKSIRTIETHDGKVHFVPAAIMLGRLWNGINARCGYWSELTGSQTMSHELGHHILGLHDGYAPDAASANYTYCSSTSNDLSAELSHDRLSHNSLMSYHYSASKLRGNAAQHYHCDNTPQTLMYAMDDWETIQTLYGLVPSNQPSVMAHNGEASVKFIAANAKGNTSLVQFSGLDDTQAMGFSIKGAPNKPTRIINQGLLSEGEQEAWYGINFSDSDRAIVLARDWNTNSVTSISQAKSILSPTSSFTLSNQRWVADLQVKPKLNSTSTLPEINAIEIQGKECGAVRGKKVNLSFCPAGGNCRTVENIDISSSRTFAATFELTAAEIAGLASHHNYLYAYSSEYQTPVATWYQIAGGFGPATAEIHAPLADGNVGLDLQAGAAASVNGFTLEVYQPAPLCTNYNNLPNYTIKQWPTLIQPYMIRDKRLLAWYSNHPPLYAQLSYDPSLYRNGIPVVLVYNPANPTAGWSVVPIVALSPELGYITVDLRNYTSQGLVYALAQ
ncbi:MAG TPA: hypothetical protein DEF47_06470 [Herpetosiphon sp.]|uniref:Uncharacterized protein n=1 Tax=Herpetosiphon aurantiacus (strain ATCC 23779 / DSM 785 / 114-95) TaxID=316274 RepID=A9B6P0_HERA2|nr:hypothetical protein [Herpetosiphon sp.]ABX04349.1 hypothetical protein Haur_1706 [Herpetosiphon aurantiacus DSM 785]HBW49529.1 hypothetical protein [Herpetosiphon sp.]